MEQGNGGREVFVNLLTEMQMNCAGVCSPYTTQLLDPCQNLDSVPATLENNEPFQIFDQLLFCYFFQ